MEGGKTAEARDIIAALPTRRIAVVSTATFLLGEDEEEEQEAKMEGKMDGMIREGAGDR